MVSAKWHQPLPYWYAILWRYMKTFEIAYNLLKLSVRLLDFFFTEYCWVLIHRLDQRWQGSVERKWRRAVVDSGTGFVCWSWKLIVLLYQCERRTRDECRFAPHAMFVAFPASLLHPWHLCRFNELSIETRPLSGATDITGILSSCATVGVDLLLLISLTEFPLHFITLWFFVTSLLKHVAALFSTVYWYCHVIKFYNSSLYNSMGAMKCFLSKH